MNAGLRRAPRCRAALLGVLLVACGPDPVAIVTGLEIVLAEGDEQFGTVDQVLGTPLRAVVRATATQEPQEGIGVRWVVLQGGAVLVGPSTATTDPTGSVEVQVRLGATPSDVEVRATVISQPSAFATFSLHTVARPELDDIGPSAAAAGDTVTVTGSNFSPVAVQNVVLFSGIRGRVVTASGSRLTVEVPSCLPPRVVSVSVQLGTIASTALALTVTGGGVVTALSPGEVLDVNDPAGFDCLALEGGTGVEYLAIAYSASTVGAAMHPYQLTALSSSTTVAATPVRALLPGSVRRSRPDSRIVWEERLRAIEGELIARARGGPAVHTAPTRSSPAAVVPTMGETRSFQVWAGSSFEEVSAVAEFVGDQAAIFVDQNAPADGFVQADLEAFAARFDDVIHPEVTGAFGSPSDLDQNQRIIILFTPVVNALTARGASGFIGGFFFGNDLLLQNNGSNGGEIFYALVPDPTGIHSAPRSKTTVLSVVPAVLAHEFQHMVHFNERFLTLDAGQEALWLSEGLAQMAEEIVARRYDALGQGQLADIFRTGALTRAERYLAAPEDVSVIVATGQGTLAERGAGFLHVLYLVDQEGVGVLGSLTSSTLTGVVNVQSRLDRAWPEVLADWWAALYLDGPDPETGPRVYPDLDLKGYLGSPFPLVPSPIGPGGTTEVGLLWSSSAAYYLVNPDSAGSMVLRLSGESGGSSSSQADLRLRIIRIP